MAAARLIPVTAFALILIALNSLLLIMNGHHLKLLKELSKDNKLSQRELSRKLGLSLGSVNYVVSNLIDAGYIRAKRFKNSKNKAAYMYILTPSGIKSRMQLSRDFLKRKLDEYEMLKMEIEELKRDLSVQDETKINEIWYTAVRCDTVEK